MFGISKASVSVIRQEVCAAIVKILLPKYICIPVGSKLMSVIDGFGKRGFPQCGGAVDGTHIPIEAPRYNAADYYNRKGWHSVSLQGVVDHEAFFTDIYVGWPGRVHDARVLKNSDIYVRGESGCLFPSNCIQSINGVNVPVVLIGDPAYPLRPWLMKPYINSGSLTPEQLCFNTRLSGARVIVEHAYGRLKGRWRCLRNRLNVSVADVPELVGACCTLHNICQAHGESFDETWLNTSCPTAPSLGDDTDSSANGEITRRAITAYLSN